MAASQVCFIARCGLRLNSLKQKYKKGDLIAFAKADDVKSLAECIAAGATYRSMLTSSATRALCSIGIVIIVCNAAFLSGNSVW